MFQHEIYFTCYSTPSALPKLRGIFSVEEKLMPRYLDVVVFYPCPAGQKKKSKFVNIKNCS